MSPKGKAIGLFLLLTLVIAGPFWLRKSEQNLMIQSVRRLVILSPHDQRVRDEIGRGFTQYWKKKTGESIDIDWRIPGGSSEIFLLLKSEYQQAFRQIFESRGGVWTHGIAQSFANPVLEGGDGLMARARRTFLESNVGIGVDLLFGGGAADFQQLAEAGYLVPGDAKSGTGISAIRNQKPEWFEDHVIPSSFAGERYRDPEDRWIGVVLASFGILFNRDVLEEVGIQDEPNAWKDLADPRLLGFLALADPAKSGSAAKAYELIIQQQMLQRQAQGTPEPIREGWLSGLRLIQRLAGNARYFTDSSGKIGLEVAQGEAAAGMAIDSYGRTIRDSIRITNGRSRLGFILPKGGTSLSVDPVAMLRGAPDPILATAFMTYLLSSEGQAILGLQPGEAGGPLHHALRRLPVRMDFYRDLSGESSLSKEPNPFIQVGDFVYHSEWTQPSFVALRFLIRVLFADSHPELVTAWKALVANGMPPKALELFDNIEDAGYDTVRDEITPILRARDKGREIALARAMGERSRARYRAVALLAEKEHRDQLLSTSGVHP